MDNDKFCIECGARMSADDKFCPACGAMAGDDGSPSGGNYTVTATAVHHDSGKLDNIKLLCLIWGVFSAVLGLYLVICCGSITDSAIEIFKNTQYNDTQSLWDYFTENGIGRNEIELVYLVIGGTMAASGLFALVSAHFQHRRQQFNVAQITLLLSAVTACTFIITLIIGIVVFFMLNKCKEDFES